ncbi:MAG: hypothetical protein NVSMB19_12830 [Vulcanimicrobiaceae bacterium]
MAAPGLMSGRWIVAAPLGRATTLEAASEFCSIFGSYSALISQDARASAALGGPLAAVATVGDFADLLLALRSKEMPGIARASAGLFFDAVDAVEAMGAHVPLLPRTLLKFAKAAFAVYDEQRRTNAGTSSPQRFAFVLDVTPAPAAGCEASRC